MGTIGKPIRKMSSPGRAVLQLEEPVRPPVQPPTFAAPGPPAVVVVVNPEATLITALRQLLASSYTLYLTAHAAHWNVEGAAFPSWHAFFGSMYEDVFSAIDPFAESIRQHGGYAPASFAEMLSNSVAMPESVGGGKEQMVAVLLEANAAEMGSLTNVRQAADAAGDEGLTNFCQERMAVHLKYDWQLKAMGK